MLHGLFLYPPPRSLQPVIWSDSVKIIVSGVESDIGTIRYLWGAACPHSQRYESKNGGSEKRFVFRACREFCVFCQPNVPRFLACIYFMRALNSKFLFCSVAIQLSLRWCMSYKIQDAITAHSDSSLSSSLNYSANIFSELLASSSRLRCTIYPLFLPEHMLSLLSCCLHYALFFFE